MHRPRLHGAGELSFEIYSHVDIEGTSKQDAVPYYGLLEKNRLIVLCADFGDAKAKRAWFVIEDVLETTVRGTVQKKSVQAYSYEKTLGRKNADFLDGTYKFYDLQKPGDTMLGKLVGVAPGWSVGHVDSALYARWRTFEGIDDSLYGFMLSDCEEAYDCLFQFDTDKRTISAYEASAFVKRTNIILTFDNLVKHLEVENDDNDIITALSVTGGGEVSIRDVNPLGDNYIYDYSYYKNGDWISPGLVAALDKWEKLVESNRKGYSDGLTKLKTLKDDLLKLEGELVTLESELKALEITRTAQFPNVQKATTQQIDAKKTAIKNKKTAIANKKKDITAQNTALDKIVAACRVSSNFSKSLLAELDEITYQGEYANGNFITTDTMSYRERQEVSEQLYQKGLAVMRELCVPQYTFKMSALNFLFLRKFAKYGGELALGKSVNVELKPGVWSYPILMELVINYDDPASFEMLFGTRLRMQRDEMDITDALYEANAISKKVSVNASVWDLPVKSGLTDRVTSYMKDTLNTANQQIVNSESQSVSFGLFGIRTQKLKADGSYDPRQLWINNGLICMTDDNWQTTKLCIGEVKGVYAVNAEVLAGKLIAGNELLITNGAGSVKIDNAVKFTDMDLLLTNGSNSFALSPAAGLKFKAGSKTLVDMDLKAGSLSMNDMSLVLTKGSNKITLDPASGFKFLSGSKTIVGMDLGTSKFTVTDMNLTLTNGANSIVVDAADGLRLRTGSTNMVHLNIKDGSAAFEGKVTAASGTIGGWSIGSDRLRNNSGDYIASDGTGKLSLLTWTKDAAWFNGNIYAKNLDNGGIKTEKMADRAISNGKLADSAVSTGKIADYAVSTGKMDSGFVNTVYTNQANIGTLFADVADIKELYARKAVIDDLISGKTRIENLQAGKLTAVDVIASRYTYTGDGGNYTGASRIIRFKDGDGSWVQMTFKGGLLTG